MPERTVSIEVRVKVLCGCCGAEPDCEHFEEEPGFKLVDEPNVYHIILKEVKH
jgi:hypothetical protein